MDVRWRALALLTLARISMGVQFQSLPSVSSGVMHDLSLGYAELGFLIGLYFLPGVAFALPAGAAGHRLGDKRVVLFGLVLMVLGGLLAASASSVGVLTAGRALSGVGAVLLNVLMSKMVTDWFAGRELSLAMSIFSNSFPIGMGLALLVFGRLSGVVGWQACLLVAALVPAAALLLLSMRYVPHPNDRASARQQAQSAGLDRRALILVCIAGAMWGTFNGALATMTSFSPQYLAAAGMDTATAASAVAAATWAVVVSVQLGGVLAHKLNAPTALFSVGCIGWAGCTLLAATVPELAGPATVAAGFVLGLPVGLILSLPGQVLQPSTRAAGMAVFFLWLYAGHGLVPGLAGLVQDWSGVAAAPLLLTSTLAIGILVLYALFRSVAGTRSGARPLRAE
ncbi:CynX/NimT family MFS transporter [Ramlibacter rhizophilus]|uniref:MFS transporter n=1 Tax=Ramlibacter rhizophilus TaxID=1781167 RepID=A0A4Z0BH93_9BURK|nr:MFS transporter [Ramlibacter rhizophilus]TFY97494.1 MFS transporter [Ramlibacter rhizophilus]